MPEETRKLAALVLLALAALALFIIWGKVTSSRLSVISPGGDATPDFVTNPPQELSATLSPTAGIVDTLKSLRDFIPGR